MRKCIRIKCKYWKGYCADPRTFINKKGKRCCRYNKGAVEEKLYWMNIRKDLRETV